MYVKLGLKHLGKSQIIFFKEGLLIVPVCKNLIRITDITIITIQSKLFSQ